jgi:hypothetical protein
LRQIKAQDGLFRGREDDTVHFQADAEQAFQRSNWFAHRAPIANTSARKERKRTWRSSYSE